MKTYKILIVDDEEDCHRIIGRILENTNYKLISAFSAEEAIRMLEITTPDLIILDWNLPNIQGPDFAIKLKNTPKYKKIPIIMYTIREGEEEKIKAFSSGIHYFLNKPINPDILIAKINQILYTK